MTERKLTAQLFGIIGAMARDLQSATLVGNPTPRVAELYKRMQNPRPGDLVIESGTAKYGRGPRPVAGYETSEGQGGGIGFLVRTAREPMPVEEWDVAVDGPIPDELVWYIRRLDKNEMVRWVNARFIAIPPFPEEDQRLHGFKFEQAPL